MCLTNQYAEFANALIDAFRARGWYPVSPFDPEIEKLRLEALKRLLAREDTGSGLVSPCHDELKALSRVLDHIEKMDQERRRFAAIEQKHGEAGLQVSAMVHVAQEREVTDTESESDASTERLVAALEKIERNREKSRESTDATD